MLTNSSQRSDSERESGLIASVPLAIVLAWSAVSFVGARALGAAVSSDAHVGDSLPDGTFRLTGNYFLIDAEDSGTLALLIAGSVVFGWLGAFLLDRWLARHPVVSRLTLGMTAGVLAMVTLGSAGSGLFFPCQGVEAALGTSNDFSWALLAAGGTSFFISSAVPMSRLFRRTPGVSPSVIAVVVQLIAALLLLVFLLGPVALRVFPTRIPCP